MSKKTKQNRTTNLWSCDENTNASGWSGGGSFEEQASFLKDVLLGLNAAWGVI